jgi:predicted kinase
MENKLNVYLCVGAPGSGKSTWSKLFVENNKNTIRVCPDEFRAKFGWGEGDQSVSAQAFEATRNALNTALGLGKNVIVDATNMYKKSRKDFITIAHMNKASVTAVIFEVDKLTLLDRNKKRGEMGGRNVPEDVIDRMLSKYDRPTVPEVDNVQFESKL